MFDPETVDLIQQAPALEGLDLQTLPKLLTDAFATVVAARIRLRAAAPDAADATVEETLALLNRLAAAQEAYVALLPGRDNRAAAAFVAGSAHQARRLAHVGEQASSRITSSWISSDISSALLFLIAEAYPDAAEVAKRILAEAEEAGPVERTLLSALRLLAEGRLYDAVALELPDPQAAGSSERAVEVLLQLLLRGVRALARQLSNPSAVDDPEEARNLFLRVKALCVEELPEVSADGRPAYSVFSGPLHLANLLVAAERDLGDAALSHLPAPTGVDGVAWARLMRRMGRARPFLWRNHRDAIAKGYMDQGRSAAISFPTGGGKSTLAELKIAASLLRNEKVVFLAPTHALVSQTVKSLQRIFQEASVFGDVDEEVTLSTILVLPEIIVTTPERCLMLLSMQPEAFADLGLIVFDECHLLHAQEGDRSRRGLDSMLCLLNLITAAPSADLLLMSAMMKNTEEMAGWLQAITGRDCLSLDQAWKPTRQARGCVVYETSRIDELRGKLQQARQEKPDQNSVPAPVKRQLTARPFGFFSLLQAWSTTDRNDYVLRALLETAEPLSTGSGRQGNWYLTPNGNKVSTAIAAGSVASGMKTLVFVQNRIACGSCVREFSQHLSPREVALTEEEAAWRALTIEEMGGADYCYLSVDADGLVRTGAASHHALLLREERELHESLFKRRDGLDALFATSTLAQGMNLPSEVVLICGDSRFDPAVDRLQQLEAHELLNAAGRAGRAGEGSQGFVLLVPSHVIAFDDAKGLISSGWMDLRAIFEQSDQCLIIEDPLEAALDLIHDGATHSGAASVLLGRLPVAGAPGTEDPGEAMLKRSFAVYRRKQAGDETWIQSRIASALAARPAAAVEESRWIGLVAAATGLSIELLERLVALVDSGALDGNAGKALTALWAWIKLSPTLLMHLVRPETLEGLFGEPYKRLPTEKARALQALDMIERLLPIWMSGAPICDLEAAASGKQIGLGHCDTGRHFAMRVAPELAFVAGLPARLVLARQTAADPEATPEISTVLATLASIVREGCDSPEALAARLEAGHQVSRVAARRSFDEAATHLLAGAPTEPFETTRTQVSTAMMAVMFEVLNSVSDDPPVDP